MHITFVKKIMADGSPCRKCAEVEQRMIQAGQMARINETVIADERDAQSPGMLLAAKFNVSRAPFFIVRSDDGAERVYTVYFKFAKEVLKQAVSEHEENRELLDQEPDLTSYV